MPVTYDNSKIDLSTLFKVYFSESQRWKSVPENVTLLNAIINRLRPQSNAASDGLQPLLELLQSNPTFITEFKAYLESLLEGRSFTEMITDVGISSNDGFFTEFRRKVTNQILPEMSDTHKMRYLFSQVFYHRKDREWILNLDKEDVIKLFNLLRVKPIEFTYKEESTMWQIYYAISVIALRASGAALEKDVVNLTPQYHMKQSPFAALYTEIIEFWESSSSDKQLKEKDDTDYKQVLVLIGQCREYIKKAFKGSESKGISLQSNKDLNRISQQLDRIELVLPLLIKEKTLTSNVKLTNLFYILMDIHSKKIKMGEFISDSARLLASEISSHQARTGENYITETSGDYWRKFTSALGGGFIVGILCIIKVSMADVDTSYFGKAFLYSANYAIGFVAIYLTGATLATKHPAMTASTMTRLIEKGLNLDVRPKFKYKAFARFFAQLIRTQFVSFLGNVIMAFPIALLGVYTIYLINGTDLTQNHWQSLLINLNPKASLLIFHAAIAGVFLFLSGLIAGEVANSSRFYGISERLAHNPSIKWAIGKENAIKLKEFHLNNWPGIMSNVWFGIFMGSIASIGAFLGLNLDIRHITFAAGNFGLGLFGANWEVSQNVVIWSLIGIVIIGFVNFIVSFGLSMLLAFRAKNVRMADMKPIMQSVLHEFTTQPLSFFIPYSTKSNEDKVEKKTKETIEKIKKDIKPIENTEEDAAEEEE